ncbi:MAG TPA: hypothetical protein VMT85_06030 [Thermoanaerobaculia bacterium]|nr:hypothetical protein [Thermoanaerobaculia bacterium]
MDPRRRRERFERLADEPAPERRRLEAKPSGDGIPSEVSRAMLTIEWTSDLQQPSRSSAYQV